MINMICSLYQLESNFSSVDQYFRVFNGWYPSGVTRTRIRVIGVNFSEFLIKGNEIQFELAGNLSYRVRVNRVKVTEKWGEIQGKLDLVRVSEEFELWVFYQGEKGFYCMSNTKGYNFC